MIATNKVVLPNNNWTTEKETKLLEWQLHSRLHSICHEQAQEVFANKNNAILIPSIIMGALAVFFDGAALVWENQHFVLVMLALFITLISTILSSIIQAMNPAELASSHENMAKGYNKIILQIDSVLTKEFSERMNGLRFLSMIEDELISLQTNGVKIESYIWETVKKDFLAKTLEFQIHESDKRDRKDTLIDIPFATTNDAAISEHSEHSDQIATVEHPKPDLTSADPIPDENLPRFEVSITQDPDTKRIQSMLYNFQMRRFG
jgi:hypothetical protein